MKQTLSKINHLHPQRSVDKTFFEANDLLSFVIEQLYL